MKDLIQTIKAYSRKLFSDLHNIILGAILGAMILSGGGIYLFAQKLWIQLKSIAQSPTPIWASIVSVLLVMEYIHLRQKVPDTKKPTVRPSFGFVDNGDLKWKVNLINGCVYRVEDAPYCVKHDLQLPHFKDGYVCFHVHEDGCESQLSDTDYNFRKSYIETVAERQFRRSEKV